MMFVGKAYIARYDGGTRKGLKRKFLVLENELGQIKAWDFDVEQFRCYDTAKLSDITELKIVNADYANLAHATILSESYEDEGFLTFVDETNAKVVAVKEHLPALVWQGICTVVYGSKTLQISGKYIRFTNHRPIRHWEALTEQSLTKHIKELFE